MEAGFVMTFIKEILENLMMRIRPNSKGLEYFEAVIRKNDLGLLKSAFINKVFRPSSEGT